MRSSDTIHLPTKLDLSNSIGFARRLKEIDPAEEFTFDFSGMRWVEPFGLLRTACAIRRFTSLYSQRSRFCCLFDKSQDMNAIDYAAFMGFFQACRFDYGNEPGGPLGNTYIPITFELVNDLLTGRSSYQSGIETVASELAQKLIQDDAQHLIQPIEYSFREIIRNVIDHSESKEIGYCAQYWPSKQRVEIAIVDTGVGLQHSLNCNPHLDIRSDMDALKYALLPGVSGKVFQGIRDDPNDPWQNSGYGLYMNYRLCNEGGDFFICSGKNGLYRTINAEDNQYIETDFQGTILRLCLNTGRLRNHQDLLAVYRHEGNMLARQSNHGANISPNKISSYLRENFRNLQAGVGVGACVQHMEFGVGQIEDIIPSIPEDLALVSFRGGRSKRVQVSSLILYDGPTDGYNYDDIPF